MEPTVKIMRWGELGWVGVGGVQHTCTKVRPLTWCTTDMPDSAHMHVYISVSPVIRYCNKTILSVWQLMDIYYYCIYLVVYLVPSAHCYFSRAPNSWRNALVHRVDELCPCFYLPVFGWAPLFVTQAAWETSRVVVLEVANLPTGRKSVEELSITEKVDLLAFPILRPWSM